MNDQTRVSVSGAIFTLAAVLLGVLLAEWLKRSNERKHLVRASTLELNLKVPHVLVGMTETNQPIDTNLGSLWWSTRETVMNLLITIIYTPTRFYWKGKTIKRQATDLHARIGAAELDFMIAGRKLTSAECIKISTSELFNTVFGSNPELKFLVDGYRKTNVAREAK